MKSKPTVINAFSQNTIFVIQHWELHIVNIILLDAFPGVTDAFPDASID